MYRIKRHTSRERVIVRIILMQRNMQKSLYLSFYGAKEPCKQGGSHLTLAGEEYCRQTRFFLSGLLVYGKVRDGARWILPVVDEVIKKS